MCRAGALLQTFGPARTFRPSPTTRRCRPTNSCRRISSADRVVIVGLSLQSAPAADAGRRGFLRDLVHAAQPRIWSPARRSRRRSTRTSPGSLFIAAASPWLLAACTLAAALLAAAAIWRGTGWLTARSRRARHRRFVRRRASCSCSSAGSTCRRSRRRSPSSLWPAAQSARDYAAERRLRRGITRAFAQYLRRCWSSGSPPTRRSCASAASARRCRSCSATCAASPPFPRR